MEAIKGYVAGLAGEFWRENRMWLAAAAVALILALVVVWKRGRAVEGFQEGPVASAKDLKIEAPPEVAAPSTEPLIQEENCDTVRKMRDALRLTEMNPKMKEFVQSEQFKAMKSEADEKFRVLGCEEYLKKIARGEIEAPKTSPDKGPQAIEEAALKVMESYKATQTLQETKKAALVAIEGQ